MSRKTALLKQALEYATELLGCWQWKADERAGDAKEYAELISYMADIEEDMAKPCPEPVAKLGHLSKKITDKIDLPLSTPLYTSPLQQKPLSSDVERQAQLDEIATVIQSWINWSKDSREIEFLSTDNETKIMVLPVPYWPSHGMLENWVNVLSKKP